MPLCCIGDSCNNASWLPYTTSFNCVTVGHVAQLRDQLLVLAVLAAGHQPLEDGGVGVAVHVHQEGRGHEVRSLLRLLVQHVVVGVPDQRPEVRVEEHLVWNLMEKKGETRCRKSALLLFSRYGYCCVGLLCTKMSMI